MSAMPRIRDIFAPYRPSVLGGYSSGDGWRNKLWLYGLVYLTALAAIGCAFAFLGTNILMPLAALIGILAILAIWAMPVNEKPPLTIIYRLSACFLIAILVWPDYIGFDFPGLPWITGLRIFGTPLAVAFLFAISVSKNFRTQLAEILKETKWVLNALIIFFIFATMSVIFSSDLSNSLNKLTVAYLYWLLIFLSSAWIFAKAKSAVWLGGVIWFAALVAIALGVWEWSIQAVPWAGHIPTFLTIDDPIIQKILTGKSRAATGIYRLQGKHTTPLGFAESLAFATPFVLYFLIYAKSLFVKGASLLTLPVLFITILRTDSRLGVVGFFAACLLAIFAWGVVRWKNKEGSIFGPALTLAWPAIFMAFMTATFFVGRLRNMVWGTKAQSYSSQAREAQWDMGIPKLFARPWGYGIGQGGETLGYRNLAGGLTIDSHYLAALLEYGILGSAAYSVIFFAALYYGSMKLLKAKTEEHFLLIPLMSVIAIFIVIKSVFAQQDNHPLVFIILGALCAICWRIEKDARSELA